jgi:hypothetical protein
MSEPVYDKKIIARFNSYEEIVTHIDNHENYHDFMVEQADTLGLDWTASYENLLWKTTWWYDQTQIECDFNDFPVWVPELEGKLLRAEVLISSQVLPFFLDRINETTQQVGQGPYSIEVVDYTA